MLRRSEVRLRCKTHQEVVHFIKETFDCNRKLSFSFSSIQQMVEEWFREHLVDINHSY